MIFPVYAGVFLVMTQEENKEAHIPRTYGGVSERDTLTMFIVIYSPRMRGCFLFAPRQSIK